MLVVLIDFFTRQSDTFTQLRVSSYRVPFSSRALRFGGGDSAAFAISQDNVYRQYLQFLYRDDSRNLCANTRIRLLGSHSSFDILSDCFAILLQFDILGVFGPNFNTSKTRNNDLKEKHRGVRSF